MATHEMKTDLKEGDYIIKKKPFSFDRETFVVTAIYKREVQDGQDTYISYKVFVASTKLFKDGFYDGELNFDYRKIDQEELEQIFDIHCQLRKIWEKK